MFSIIVLSVARMPGTSTVPVKITGCMNPVKLIAWLQQALSGSMLDREPQLVIRAKLFEAGLRLIPG